ncbi:MAG: peptide chain release factor N(5)-glutamine methyltransferase [Candidatus Gastranaerophilaceae bacterium]
MDYKNNLRKIYSGFDISPYDRDSEIEFVIYCMSGLKTKDLILEKTPDNIQKEKIIKTLEKRVKTGCPIQQIVGKAFFAGDEFIVNENTLIPRPETEFLVQKCKFLFSQNSTIKILDIGTGSGCISIELAKYFSQAKITAIDICQATLDVAALNIEKHQLQDKITLCQSDIYKNISEKFDLIVSNPPYIPLCEKEFVQKDVYEFEPHTALFAKNKGLFFYEEIIQKANNYLNINGYLVFEIGINQSKPVSELFLKNKFVNIDIIKDFNGIDRIISAQYK